MAASLTIRERTLQCERWLRANYPTPYPVVVRWVAKVPADPGDPPTSRARGYLGDCYWVRPNTVIRLSRRRCRETWIAVETLMHEWAHAVVMPNDRVWKAQQRHGRCEEHPDEFGLVANRIYRAWYDEGGALEASASERAPRRRPAR